MNMDGMDLDTTTTTSADTDSGTIGVRKNIALKLSTDVKKKPVRKDELQNQQADIPYNPEEVFVNRNYAEPLHKGQPLKWDYPAELVGEKVINPLIHCCEKCTLPILVYGRLAPCKHIMCWDCAMKSERTPCPRCHEVISRIERCSLGSIVMCTFEGSRHGTGGCRKTYLSTRDLQAHQTHRHGHLAPPPNREQQPPQPTGFVESQPPRPANPPPLPPQQPSQPPPMPQAQPYMYTTTSAGGVQMLPVIQPPMVHPSNLITIPIQDPNAAGGQPIYLRQAPPMQQPQRAPMPPPQTHQMQYNPQMQQQQLPPHSQPQSYY